MPAVPLLWHFGGHSNRTLILVLDVNQTRWCEASLNLALCDGPRASSDRCVEFWNASNSQGCVVCICTVWLLALLIALHARWLGLSLAKAYTRLTNLCRKCEAMP